MGVGGLFLYPDIIKGRANIFPSAVQPGADVLKPDGPDWKATNKRVYNWLTHAPHLLDLARHLVGPITALRSNHREVALGGNGGEPIRGHVWRLDLRFANGAGGQSLLLLPRPGEFEEGFQLHCAGGHVTCTFPYVWFQREETRLYSARSKMFCSPDTQDCHTFRLQLEALARTILTGGPQLNANLEDGIACVKALVAGSYSALNDGKWVDIEATAGDVANPRLRVRDFESLAS